MLDIYQILQKWDKLVFFKTRFEDWFRGCMQWKTKLILEYDLKAKIRLVLNFFLSFPKTYVLQANLLTYGQSDFLGVPLL